MELKSTDLIIDQVYKGSRNGNASDDPLPHLLGVDNSAGFRHLGKRPGVDTLKLLVLKTNFNDPEWPDKLETTTGHFTYYGDNKKVGRIHDTPRQGNLILKNLFDSRHSSKKLNHFPPIFLFSGLGKGHYRDVRFLGLAVPGSNNLGPDEDLVALWKSTGLKNERFQNYKSIFTILDIPSIDRKWITDIQLGNAVNSSYAPKIWLDWLNKRTYKPLLAPPSLEIRSKVEQLPTTTIDKKIIELVYGNYKDNPFEFERVAVAIAKLLMPRISNCDLTQPWRDGGRDALGTYRVGENQSFIDVEFSLEAKCYHIKNGVGVKELSRLISRLKHRQFGILVTTSYVSDQAYKEIIFDGHPIIVISAIDIAEILKKRVGNYTNIKEWLKF